MMMNSTASEMTSLYIIDGSSFLYRAYYAFPYLSTKNGIPTRVIYGFLVMLKKILKDQLPDYICVTFDSKAPTFRHEMLETYKIKRPPMPDEIKRQIPYIHELLDIMKIHMVVKDGIEADDVIASLVDMFKGQTKVVIVSPDKDLFQLAGRNVIQWHPQKDMFIDTDKVKELMGIEPSQIADFLALAGDQIDGVPGVKGIGEKTAQKLIQKYGDLESIYRNIHDISGKTGGLLSDGKDIAFLSRDLCRLQKEHFETISLDDMKVQAAEPKALLSFLKEMEFFEMISEFGLGGQVDITTPEIFDYHKKNLSKSEVLFLMMTNDENMMPVALATGAGLGIVKIRNYQLGEFFATHKNRRIVTFASKTAYKYCIANRIDLFEHLDDLSLASYILNPGVNHSHTAQDIFKGFYGILPDASVEKKKSLFPEHDAIKKAAVILKYTPAMSESIMNDLSKDKDNVTIYKNIELPLSKILAQMELWGIRIEKSLLEEMREEGYAKLTAIEAAIHETAGKKFNIGSPKQLSAVLYEDLKLKPAKKGKTGFSTASDVLEELSGSHTIIPLILEYRNISKLMNTYVDTLPGYIQSDGRIHTTFNQTLTATGRLSSSEPNMQNIPVKLAWGERIRKAFVADEGAVLISADYSQIEIRILAEMSKDEILIDDFKNKRDIHTVTAAKIFDTHTENVTKEMRRQAKTINFGILYGMGAYSLSKELGVLPKKAEEFIQKYFDHYKGVKLFREMLIEKARENKYVASMFGRKRHVHDIDSADHNTRMNAERIALNSPLQSTAADIVKMAMIDVYYALQKENISFKILLQIHDELLFEVDENDVEKAGTVIKRSMMNVVSFTVPLEVRIGTGKNWFESSL